VPSDLRHLISSLDATLHPEPVAFCLLDGVSALPRDRVIASVREKEGQTIVLEERDARAAGLQPVFRAEWITLNVQSPLDAVGLTAAFSAALAEARISCNVIAGVHHDHIFVAQGDGRRALDVLHALATSAREQNERGAR
jgi:uncharacterized protein